MFRSDNANFSRFHVVQRSHPAHAAIMIAMTVTIKHRSDWPHAKRFVDQIQRSGSRFFSGQRINQNPARCSLDHSHVRNVKAAHLPDAIADLVKPVFGKQLLVPPEARVHTRRCIAFHPGISIQIPNRLAACIANDRVFARGQKALTGKAFIAPVIDGKALGSVGLRCDGGGACRLRCQVLCIGR